MTQKIDSTTLGVVDIWIPQSWRIPVASSCEHDDIRTGSDRCKKFPYWGPSLETLFHGNG